MPAAPEGLAERRPDRSAPDAGRAPHAKPSGAARIVVIAVLAATTVAGWVGNAIAPALVARHPLTLVALNPSNRYLLLSGPRVDLALYLLAATARRFLPVLSFFLIGRWYGDRAVRWLERRSPDGGTLVRQVEGWFGRAAWPLVVAVPIGAVGLLAGAAGMGTAAVLATMALSIFVRVLVIRLVGHAFSGPVDSVVEWIDRLRGPLLVVTVGLVAITLVAERRRRASSLEELTHLGDETTGP